MPVAAITGATGFIGRRIAESLHTQGWQVRALVRSPSAASTLKSQGMHTVLGALEDRSTLETLLCDTDAVIHCAGVVRGADYQDFARVNVDGTANLRDAMHGKKLPLVALSSLAAREPQLSHYARSKRAMEAELVTQHAPRDCLLLRPPAVYGPGEKELLPLFQAFARGVAPLPASPQARVSLLYVDDLAAAILSWLKQSKRESGIFELHDGQPDGYSWDEVVQVAESLLGRRIRKIALPGTPLRLLSSANATMSRLIGHAPMLTPGKIRELRHSNWVCDNGPLQKVLDWHPQVDLAQGLHLTCGWGQRIV